MAEFLNRGLDASIDDNLRWAIMRKIILKILESCDHNQLTEIMITYTKQFEQILNEHFSNYRNKP